MFERLDNATRLTTNQIKIIAAAIIGDMLEFFDYYLIAFVLAFIVKPWKLTALESAIILLSSGVGAILGGILGGFKGALAGILVGGGGTIAATEGKQVDLPQGTVLRVRFDSPLKVAAPPAGR